MNKSFVMEKLCVPLSGDFDVIVAGAGPAGVCAALAAARAGAHVLLIEANGCLGGTWTAGLLCWVLDADKPGIIRELAQRLEAAGARGCRRSGTGQWSFDPEAMKFLLEELCSEAGVQVQLHTRLVAAQVDGDATIRTVQTESRSGRQAWSSRLYIDCTGDGDLARHAGCGFDLGHPETGDLQPASMTVLVTGLHFDALEPFVGGGLYEPKKRLAQAIRDAGLEPSYGLPVLFHVYDDLYAFIPNHQYGVPCDDAAALTRATFEARRECHAVVTALRQRGGCWSDMRIVATTEHLGMREGRRIHGLYTVSQEDMLQGVLHDDAVCRVTFGFDVHNTRRNEYGSSQQNKIQAKPYDIPLRSLIARDVNNLMMAGRCVSGDFFAHSSYRVTGNAAAMGEAVGVVAARAARTHVPLAEITPAATDRTRPGER